MYVSETENFKYKRMNDIFSCEKLLCKYYRYLQHNDNNQKLKSINNYHKRYGNFINIYHKS